MKRLCTICARGGSKGIVNKNLRNLLGYPLLAHSLLQAKASHLFDSIAVSSDSDEILRVAQEFGATVLVTRPGGLASDTAPKIPAIQHCVKSVEAETHTLFDIVVDLDATSPLRTPDDIRQCIRLIEEEGAPNVVTGMHSRRSPYFNLLEKDDSGTLSLSKTPPTPILRRQDAPQCFDMNASIYAWRKDVLLSENSLFLPATQLYVMPEERSWDIDSELDFRIVELLLGDRRL
jgi:CMP-N,N'-diacetyllegionaminic acid synthase